MELSQHERLSVFQILNTKDNLKKNEFLIFGITLEIVPKVSGRLHSKWRKVVKNFLLLGIFSTYFMEALKGLIAIFFVPGDTLG